MTHKSVGLIRAGVVLLVFLLLGGCGGGQNPAPSQPVVSGTLDAGFGDHGIQKAQLDQVSFSGFFAVQPDGKIVASGLSAGGYAVVRFNRDGSLDTGFGSGGKVTVPPDAGTPAVANKLAVQSTGKVIMVGWSDTPTGIGMDVLRFMPDGTPDAAWTNPGPVIAPPAANRMIVGVKILPDDKVVLVGTDLPNQQGLVFQLDQDGHPDTAFGNNGIATVPAISGLSGSAAQRVEAQGDGKLVVAGYAWSGLPSQYSAYLMRLYPSGVIDPSFGSGGIVTFGDGGVGGLAVSDTGMLVSVSSLVLESGPGYSYSKPTTSTLYRFTASGQADASFGNGGMVSNQLDIESLFVDSRGRVIVVGANEATSEAGITRYLPTGSLDASFGGTGEIGLPGVQPYFWIGTGPDEKVLVSGQSSDSSLVMMQYNP